jgi:hypothetical protein
MGEEKTGQNESFAKRPQRKLFGILLAVFFLWMGVLLVLYFKTVRPERLRHRSIPIEIPAGTAPAS